MTRWWLPFVLLATTGCLRDSLATDVEKGWPLLQQTPTGLGVAQVYTQKIRADIFLNRGQFNQAVAALRQALEMDRTDPFLRASLGEALMEKGDFAEARRQLLKAISLDPSETAYRLSFARLADKMGNRALAIRAIKAAMVLNPMDPAPCQMLKQMGQHPGETAKLQGK